MLLFQIFEGLTVIFETLIVQQYIGGLFEQRSTRRRTLMWYALFCFGLMLLSLITHDGLYLTTYTLAGIYTLVVFAYKTTVSSRIFSVFYFSVIMVGSEIFTSGIISGIWGIELEDALSYGLPRVLCILVAKLMQIFLLKASVTIVNLRADTSSKDEVKMMIPLLLCQVFSALLAHSVFSISESVFNGFSVATLMAMAGIMYMNIIMFWYFDRVKAIFEYKSKIESAELKIELQKQYYETLSEHQQETDRLWHDMKNHISLMKSLINDGQVEITNEYVHELEAQMSDTLRIVRTDFPILSALLTEQKQRASKAGISFDLDVKLESDIRISPVDLCIILGNLFDNAFAACIALPQEKEKWIKSSIIQRSKVIDIRIENTYDTGAKYQRRSGKHGLGLKNVQQAVFKYNGQFKTIEANGIYTVSIIVP